MAEQALYTPGIEQTLDALFLVDRTPTIADYFASLYQQLGICREDPVVGNILTGTMTGQIDPRSIANELLTAAQQHPSLPRLNIDTLFIGVHPDWAELGDAEFEAMDRWLDQMAGCSNVALVMFPWMPRYYTAKQVELSIRGQRAAGYVNFWKRFCEWESKAADILDSRFCYWPNAYPFGGAIEGNEPLDVAFLKLRFGAKPQAFIQGSDEEYLFKQIIVFGQHPSSCAARQTYDSHLNRLTLAPRYSGYVPCLPEESDWQFYR